MIYTNRNVQAIAKTLNETRGFMQGKSMKTFDASLKIVCSLRAMAFLTVLISRCLIDLIKDFGVLTTKTTKRATNWSKIDGKKGAQR